MPDRDDDRTNLDRHLARLGAATADLDADDRFADAVLRAVAEVDDPLTRAAAKADDPLTRAARATADLAPDAAFTDAVLRAVQAESTSRPVRLAVGDGIVRSGRAAIFVAALAAAASVLFFFQTQRQIDAAIVSSVDTIEDVE